MAKLSKTRTHHRRQSFPSRSPSCLCDPGVPPSTAFPPELAHDLPTDIDVLSPASSSDLGTRPVLKDGIWIEREVGGDLEREEIESTGGKEGKERCGRETDVSTRATEGDGVRMSRPYCNQGQD
jgi:hypothetical protein